MGKVALVTVNKQVNRIRTLVEFARLLKFGRFGDILAAAEDFDFGDVHLLATVDAELEAGDSGIF